MELSLLYLPKTKENQLIRKGLETIEDVLEFLPKEYYDFTETYTIKTSVSKGFDENIAIIGHLKTVKYTPKTVVATIVDRLEKLDVVFMNQFYKYQQLLPLVGREVIVCGKISINPYNHSYEIISPLYFSTKIDEHKKLIPRYVKIKGMSKEYFEKIVDDCLDFAEDLDDWDDILLNRFGIMTRENCLFEIHKPSSNEKLKEAYDRLIFDKLFKYLWLAREKECDSIIETEIKLKNIKLDEKVQILPFPLTGDQDKTIRNILNKMSQGHKVKGLIQGDVGCGKTIVAFLLMFILADNGYQSVLIAPTQTLANQHYLDILEYAEKFGYTVGFLSGSTKTREKNRILKELKNGTIDILVSTHAGFSPNVEYNNLGLKIIDEEHRFGVKQRESLSKRYKEIHSLSMSATPIPRSLALITHGNNIEIYNILELPKGRQKVETITTNETKKAYSYIVNEIKKGHQAYIVCPLIDEGKIEAKNVKQITNDFQNYLSSLNLDFSVSSIYGDMKQEQIDKNIEDFNKGKIDVLVSTTIVEVGVNVPNATVMVILSSERFGLSQLHQLRGRVGRGNNKSYCVLVSPKKGLARLQIMKNSSSGFDISKEDLKLRGPGELLGLKQSGQSEELMLILTYPTLVSKIRDEIEKIYEDKERLEFYQKITL
ncbi:ATP-dependent DNA helicase RecG [Peptoniphilus timonensis]|uniref:ATP-dependent DNA helicase RecG n=1 Tax=Peptoniphilus timonensis TaxID=1268254 RepID=UPI0002DBFB57|nr:ATP-dependent DNA helicase RecG [Peptoniphilus timonensis]